MTQQLDMFREREPIIEQPTFIGPDNSLLLVPPEAKPTGPESAERKAARLREIEERKEKKGVAA